MVGSATEHQISDGVGVLITAAPGNCLTAGGHHPDHAGFPPDLTMQVGVAHVGCPLTTVRIKSTPGDGLDCEGHWSSVELRSV